MKPHSPTTAARPVYDVVLIEHRDGQWSAEPIGIIGCLPGQFLATDRNLAALLTRDARALVATATGHDTYDFDLRFLGPDGDLLATATINTQSHTQIGTFSHELLDIANAERLRPHLDDLRAALAARR